MSIRQYKFLYQICSKYCISGTSLLDWGSGSGHFSLFLSHLGFIPTAYGFEFPEIITDKIYNNKVKFIQGLSDEPSVLPFDAYEFNVIFSVGVLEHVREYGGTEAASLSEIHRVLKQGGFFICCHLPNRTSWIEFTCRSFGFWSHQYCYNKTDIDQLFDREKWLVVEKYGYGFLPGNSMGKFLPGNLKNSLVIANAFDFLDTLLNKFLSKFSQNWLVIARKI